MSNFNKKTGFVAIAVSLGLALGACSGQPQNRSLYSTKQPVVERSNYSLDLASGAGGLTVAEQARLNSWFETLELGYGDSVYVDDPLSSGATREAVAQIAGRHGVLISQGAPVTPGYVDPGTTRVVVSRARAYVPGCPDWSSKDGFNWTNGTSPGYGCAVNSNLAAMVANPQHLIEGEKGTGETVVATSNRAIQSYRDAEPTGVGGLQGESLSEGGN